MPTEIRTKRHTPLKKVLGIAFGLAIVIGSTIGVGILRTPGTIAGLIPNATVILACWIAIALYIMLSASAYAELTTMFPKAGGAYNYIKEAFGNYAGFVTGWFDFLCNAIAPAYFCIVLSEYLILIFPQYSGYEKIIAAAALTIFAILNFPGVRSGSFFQKVTSAVKVLLFAILIVGCFLHEPQNAVSVPVELVGGTMLIALFQSLQFIMGTYDGWMSVSFFAEEDSNPEKNVPRSYLYGAATIGLLYVLINAAILYVLPIEEISNSSLAASKAASVAFGNLGAILMTAVAIFSLTSILNAYMMIPSRILFGLSRDGFFPKFAMKVNRGGTPYYSLMLCYFFALLLILWSSFETLFALATFMMTIVTGFAFASLVKLRKSAPDMPRPYRAWGYPYTTWLAILVTTALFIGFAFSDRFNFVIIIGITILTYFCYRLFIRRRS